MEVRFGPDLSYFFCSVVLGIGLAVLYDLIRFSRKAVKTADIIVNIEDILFIMLSGCLVAATAYLANNGFFRFYSLISVALGFLLYRLTVRGGFVWLLMKLYGGILKLLKLIIRILLMPIRFAVRLLSRPVVFTVGSVRGKLKRRNKKRHTA